MDDGMRTVILTIALVAAAIDPVLIVLGKVISSVGTIMTLLLKLVSAFNAVKTVFSALSAVMMTNPIAIIIAVIAALVKKHYDALTERYNNTKEKLDTVTAEINRKELTRAALTDFQKAFGSRQQLLTKFDEVA